MARRRPDRDETEAELRIEYLRCFEALCPNVIGNPYIPHDPHPPQARFLGLHQGHEGTPFQALFGGAAGGGKSDALLMAAAQYAWRHGDFAGLILRRTFADLALPGAIMDRAITWWRPLGVHWNDTTKTFTFPSGAKVSFAYLQHEYDHLRYQGAEFQLTCWDELTQFPLESQYSYVGISRVRRKDGCTIPLRTLGASNPGGPGHDWVRRKFVGDPENGVEAPHLYLPARIRDNPSIDQASYIAGLEHLHPTVRAQLLNGDWRARDPGDYFRAEWFGPLLDPETDMPPRQNYIGVRWWDLAASENVDACRTAGVLMIRTRFGVRAVTHAVAFRMTPGSRDDAIVRQAQVDGRHIVVGIEIEPGSGGIAQFESLAKRLRAMGYRVDGAKPRVTPSYAQDRNLVEQRLITLNPTTAHGKEGRADPVAACLERGYQQRGECPDTGAPGWGSDATRHWSEARSGLRLFVGPWTQGYLDELEGFPGEHGATLVDLVDATSGAWAWLEAHPFGQQVAPVVQKKAAVGDDGNTHPDDRDRERDRAERNGLGSAHGRW